MHNSDARPRAYSSTEGCIPDDTDDTTALLVDHISDTDENSEDEYRNNNHLSRRSKDVFNKDKLPRMKSPPRNTAKPMYKKLLHFFCPLLAFCQMHKGSRLSWRQKCWLFCKGTIVLKITMGIVKLSIIIALMYFGVSDSEAKIQIKDPPTSLSYQHSPLSTCPYIELATAPRLNWVQKSLINLKWFLTLPIIVGRKLFLTRPSEKKFKYYNCSLGAWTPEFTYEVWSKTVSDNQSNQLAEFKKRMSLEELKMLQKLLRTLIENLEKESITYFLFGQSLLDSYRHHGMARWGDSVNIAVPISVKTRIRTALQPLESKGYILSTGDQEWYFFLHNSYPIKRFKHKWPHIEISFYGENMRQIWDKNYKFAYTRRYERKFIFPLVKRPFFNLWLNAPNNASEILGKDNISECSSPTGDHKQGKWIPGERVRVVSCAYLYDQIPLVFRPVDHQAAGYEVEVLRIGQREIQTVIITSQM